MAIPLVALLGAAIHQSRLVDPDEAELQETLTHLAQTAGDAPVTLQLVGDDLLLDAIGVHPETPGAAPVREALRHHGVTLLRLPGGLESPRWAAVVSVLAAAAGLYPTVAQFREAIQTVAPDSWAEGEGEGDDGARGRGGGAIPTGGWVASEAVPLGRPDGERSSLSAELDPLVTRGRRALEANDLLEVAEVLLVLREMEQTRSDGAVVAVERRRLATPRVLEAMARELANPSCPLVYGKALNRLGAEAADAIVVAMRDATHRTARRTYVTALSEIAGADETIVAALGGTESHLLADVAEVAGRRALEAAVPGLSVLLRHHDEDVRTAAWRALEQIGTPEAMRALTP